MTIEEAIAAFRNGEFTEAKRISIEAVKSGQERSIVSTPYPLAVLLEGFHRHLLGDREAAFRGAYHILQISHGHRDALNLLHLVLDSIAPSGSESCLLFGLGTGRSGSSTLTRLLQEARGVYASHEHLPLVRWQSDPAMVDWHLKRMRLLARGFRVVADISHWWLPHVDQILASCPEARFLAVRRPKADVVRSFMRLSKDGVIINHWRDGPIDQVDWSSTYPSYSTDDTEEAISRYWDDYYSASSAYAAMYPDRFKLVEFGDLVDGRLTRLLSDWLGLEFKQSEGVPHLNQATIQDGKFMIPSPFV